MSIQLLEDVLYTLKEEIKNEEYSFMNTRCVDFAQYVGAFERLQGIKKGLYIIQNYLDEREETGK